MTIDELIRELTELHHSLGGDARVILAKDPEGNGFSPLASCQRMYYEPSSTWSGQCYPLREDDPEYYAEHPDNPFWEPQDSYCDETREKVVELGPVN